MDSPEILKIIVIGTECWTFEKFRGTLLRNLVLDGHEILAIGSDFNSESFKFLESIGVKYYEVSFAKSRFHLLSIFTSLTKIKKIYFDFKPDACLAFFLKPIFIATLVKLFIRFKLVSLVEGLGHPFSLDSNKYSRTLFRLIMKTVLFYSNHIVFLNQDDKNELLPNCSNNNRNSILSGIGVDVTYYKSKNVPPLPVKFLFLSRLLKSKGLIDYIDAATILKRIHKYCEFNVYGKLDYSVHGVSENLINSAHNKGVIYYGGLVHDVRDVIKRSHVLVLPTYYREGLPRCIQESMSMGKPVITTKYAGCSVIIQDKVNGIIVKPKDVENLVESMKWFCENTDKLNSMRYECRTTALKYFDSKKVDRTIIKIITK